MESIGNITSQAQLARIVGRNPGVVSRWIARKDWPFGKPPWKQNKVAEILNWVTVTLREQSDVPPAGATVPPDDDDEEDEPGQPARNGGGKESDAAEVVRLRKEKLKQEIRRLSALAEGAEMENTVRAGSLYIAEDVDREFVAVGNQIRNDFQSQPANLLGIALSNGMPQESAADFQAQVEASNDAILQRLSGGFRFGAGSDTLNDDAAGGDDDDDQ